MTNPYVHRTEAGRKRAALKAIALERETLEIAMGLRPEPPTLEIILGRVEAPLWAPPTPEELAEKRSRVVLLSAERYRRGGCPTPSGTTGGRVLPFRAVG